MDVACTITQRNMIITLNCNFEAHLNNDNVITAIVSQKLFSTSVDMILMNSYNLILSLTAKLSLW